MKESFGSFSSDMITSILKRFFALGLCFAFLSKAIGSETTTQDAVLLKALSDVQKFQQPKDRPYLADALYNVSLRYIALGQYKHAEEYLQKALDIERALHRHLTRAEVLSGKQDPKPLLRDLNRLASVFIMDGRPADAIEILNEAISEAGTNRDEQDRNQDLSALNNQMALAQTQAGHPEEAERTLLQAAKTTGGSTKAKILQDLAGLYRQEGKLAKACAAMSAACSLLEADDVKYGTALCQLGALQDEAGQSQSAMHTYETVLQKFDRKADSDIVANAEEHIGDCYHNRGQLQQALQHYLSAAELTKDCAIAGSNNVEAIATCVRALNGAGMAYADMDRLAEATAEHQQAFKLATQYNISCKLDVAQQVATDYLIEGKAEQALDALTSSLDQSSLRSEDKANLNLLMGSCYRALLQQDQAIKLIQDAIHLYRAAGDLLGEADATNALATVYVEVGQADTAEQLLSDALKKLSASDDVLRRALLNYNLGQAKLVQRKFEEALPIFESALGSLRDTNNVAATAALERELGLTHLFLKHYDKALQCYQRALEADRTAGSIESQWSSNLGVGEAYMALEQPGKAEPYLKTAADLVEKERSSLTRDSFKTYNLDFRRNCFLELVALYMKTNRPLEALAMAERGKARATLDMLSNRQHHDLEVVGTTSGDKERALALKPGDAGSRSVSVIDKGVPPVFVDATAVSPENTKAPDEQEIKSLVASRGSTCVEYLPLGDKLYTWVIKPDGTVMAPPPSTCNAELSALAADFIHTITQSGKTPAEMTAQTMVRQQKLKRMYSLLIAPVEQWLPKDPDAVITIIPDTYLFIVPFAALVDDKGTFLIEKHTLSYSPAIGVFRATQLRAKETGSKPHKLLAFGDPITPQNAFLGDLSHAKAEVDKIYKLYEASKADAYQPLIKEQATKAAYLDLSPKATDIHLATHGLVDEQRPMQSSLVLAPSNGDSGRLTAGEVIKSKLNSRLVVLSACETGRGKITGDGVNGLARSFIIAGTPSVMVSQWNVDDVMTEFQMIKFYRDYLKGKNKAAALRAAQIATIRFMENTPSDSPPIIDASKPRANPRYWAAFQLIGEFN